MQTRDGSEIITFADADQWEDWLAEQHGLQHGVWLKIAKKGSGCATVTITEALDVALCHGWIDSMRRTFDERYYLQRYSPRRKRSLWSKVNIAKAEALIAAGRMREPGFAEIAAAQADGRWDAAYASARCAVVPPDLTAALDRDAAAKDVFASLGRTDRYLVVLRLMTARTPDVRAARLERMVVTLRSGEKVR